ncbi:MAG: isocitrate lyase/PEP mutase family protein [Rhodospirillaceae bacterium]|nr:isocitrate lyase/PEP mutase family protein [Rhodospirillaceae bacterium]
MSHAKALRDLLKAPGVIIAPGMYDALTALLIEQHKFKCAYMGGASISYTRIAQPDIGLTTLSEVAQVVSHVRERVSIPFVVDIDTGFGNALNTQRTVRLLERMGASGMQLEDQTYPKRCGHLAGKTLVSTAEMVGKLKAALDARADSNTVIVARTDAIAVEGIDRALERAHAYMNAGADVLFIEAPQTTDQMARLGKTFAGKIPLIANMVEGGKTPLKPAKELGELGFKMAIYPGALVRMVAHAASYFLKILQEDGDTARARDRMFDFAQLNAILDLDQIMAAGQKYDEKLAKAAE